MLTLWEGRDGARWSVLRVALAVRWGPIDGCGSYTGILRRQFDDFLVRFLGYFARIRVKDESSWGVRWRTAAGEGLRVLGGVRGTCSDTGYIAVAISAFGFGSRRIITAF